MAPENQQTSDSRPFLKQILREPTLHFLLIAALIFTFFMLSQTNNLNVLEISQREIDARIFLQEMTSGEALTEEQRQFIASTYVEEQILVQEALAMGLDNDARIHDMLAQKMRHVLSGNIIQPSAAELSDYYRSNSDRYQTLATVTVDELVFNTSEQLPLQVATLLEQGSEPQILIALEPGNTSPLPNVNHIDLTNIFAPEFADEVFASEIGQWTGPFLSNRGQHWLRVIQQIEVRLPALEEIADRVRLDWIAEEEDSRLQQEIDNLWDRYSIIIIEDSDSR